ncbi:class I SAM-dependent methyltransferase [Streptomyces sp. NPDC048845]|uniref:class I SAM-dependent methyltransferase n=1 Tax=Streptomyces sp. NPDC048845 TaxID=3155390 RepID=UPI00342071F8
MDRGERQLHSSSFGAAAAAYAEHRPDYAQAAVRWALEPAPGPRVLDLGAGTGKLTATLVATGSDVTAVEPDPAMLTELCCALPAVRALQGSAEAIPLPDASVDAVLAGNAMHWFDMAVAGAEIARVLAPGGILAGLWNVMDDRVEWVAELARVSGSAAVGPRDTPAGWRAETAGMHLPKTGGAARFGSPEQAEFPHGQRRTADSLVATLATRAGGPGHAGTGTPAHARPDPRIPCEQAGDRRRRVHPPDADRRTARAAAVRAVDHLIFLPASRGPATSVRATGAVLPAPARPCPTPPYGSPERRPVTRPTALDTCETPGNPNSRAPGR